MLRYVEIYIYIFIFIYLRYAVNYIDVKTQMLYNLRVSLPVKIPGFGPVVFPRYLHHPLVEFLLSGRQLF